MLIDYVQNIYFVTRSSLRVLRRKTQQPILECWKNICGMGHIIFVHFFLPNDAETNVLMTQCKVWNIPWSTPHTITLTKPPSHWSLFKPPPKAFVLWFKCWVLTLLKCLDFLSFKNLLHTSTAKRQTTNNQLLYRFGKEFVWLEQTNGDQC